METGNHLNMDTGNHLNLDTGNPLNCNKSEDDILIGEIEIMDQPDDFSEPENNATNELTDTRLINILNTNDNLHHITST
jgi:hypothetical protein